MQDGERTERDRSALAGRMKKGALLGLPLLALGAAVMLHHHRADEATTAAAPPSPVTAQMGAAPANGAAGPADFRGEQPSPDARLMANWVAATGDNRKHAFIIVDKPGARAYVFTPDGHLKDSAPVLLGSARGDDVLPGVGDKTPAQMKPEEKTTPAGRFVAQPGKNADDEDVIWVDYDDAISMHRVRPLVASEQRLERLATLTTDDNRISFGCINLPVTFYEDVAKPVVSRYGAIIYVLPEVKTVQQVFGAYDVTDPRQVAAARQATLADGSRNVAGQPAVQG